MTLVSPAGTAGYGVAPDAAARESHFSAVSWGAVFGGAAVATAVTVLLTALGSGVGFASYSPWSMHNPSAKGFTAAMAIWMIVVQWISAGLGGYLAGRMRTKWTALHTDEVFFRDTANGLITWAVASLFVVAVVSGAATSLVSGGAHMAGQVGAGAAQGGAQNGNAGYYVDSLLRPSQPNAAASTAETRGEVARILAEGAGKPVSQDDRTYLAQVVAAHTGLSQDDAQKRVDDVLTREKQATDAARKTASAFAFYTFFSMLIGAFIAATAAALGGRERDAI